MNVSKNKNIFSYIAYYIEILISLFVVLNFISINNENNNE